MISGRQGRNWEYSQIQIWEEDFSQVLRAIDDLNVWGIQDVRGYLEAHPELSGTPW